MSEYVEFRSRVNHPLPIDLGNGEAISVAAKGTFKCTPEQARSRWVERERLAKRIQRASTTVVEKLDTVPPPSGNDAGVVEVDTGVSADDSSVSEPFIQDDGFEADIETSDEFKKDDDSLTSSSEMMESEEESVSEDIEPPKYGRSRKRKSKRS